MKPAVGGNTSFAGINADDDRVVKFTTGFFNQLGVFYGDGAEDNTFDTSLKYLLNRFQLADASAELSRHQYGAGDFFDNVQITELTLGGTIKVNDMDSGSSQRLPAESYLYGVIREAGFLVVITLIETDAPAISKVYSGDYFYGSITSQVNIGELSPGSGIECLVILVLVFENVKGSI